MEITVTVIHSDFLVKGICTFFKFQISFKTQSIESQIIRFRATRAYLLGDWERPWQALPNGPLLWS